MSTFVLTLSGDFLTFFDLAPFRWPLLLAVAGRKAPAISTRHVRVKSWQPMSTSWPTSSQPDFGRALGWAASIRHLM